MSLFLGNNYIFRQNDTLSESVFCSNCDGDMGGRGEQG